MVRLRAASADVSQPAFFRSVGTYYADFHQVDDEEVIALLDAARSRYET